MTPALHWYPIFLSPFHFLECDFSLPDQVGFSKCALNPVSSQSHKTWSAFLFSFPLSCSFKFFLFMYLSPSANHYTTFLILKTILHPAYIVGMSFSLYLIKSKYIKILFILTPPSVHVPFLSLPLQSDFHFLHQSTNVLWPYTICLTPLALVLPFAKKNISTFFLDLLWRFNEKNENTFI